MKLEEFLKDNLECTTHKFEELKEDKKTVAKPEEPFVFTKIRNFMKDLFNNYNQ